MWKLREFFGYESLWVAYIAFLPSHIFYELLIWGLSAAVNDMLLTQSMSRELSIQLPTGSLQPSFSKDESTELLNFYSNHTLIYTKPNLHLYLTRYNHTLKEAEQNLTDHKILIKFINCFDSCFNELKKSA